MNDKLVLPPINAGAEQYVLGSMMVDEDVIIKVGDIINSEDFYRGSDKNIYNIILKLWKKGISPDVVSVGMEIPEQVEYLTKLVDNITTVGNAEHYAREMKEYSNKRKLMRIASDMMRDVKNDDIKVSALQEMIYSQMDEVDVKRRDYSNAKELTTQSLDMIDDMVHRPEQILGFRTGYDFDDTLGGFMNGEVYFIAGDTGSGKTMLTLNIARQVGVQNQKTGVIFSYEMSKKHLFLRMMFAEAQVKALSLKYNQATGEDYKKISGAASRLSQMNLYVFEDMDIGVWDIYIKVKKLEKMIGKIDYIVVDHINLMHEKKRFDSRNQELDYVSRQLKNIAKKLDMPVIAVAQLNRNFSQRQDPRPRLSDLRDCGALEQIASSVIFIYRPCMYFPDDEFGTNSPDKTEIIIGKNRYGALGTSNLRFIPEQNRFENVRD